MGFLVLYDTSDECRYQLAESEVAEEGVYSIPIIPEAALGVESLIPKYCSFEIPVSGEKKRIWLRIADLSEKTGIDPDAVGKIDRLPLLAKAVIEHQKVERALKKVFGEEGEVIDWAPALSKWIKKAKEEQIDIRLHKSEVPFDGAVHINKDGRVFVDFKKSLMEKGSGRKFKQCLDLSRGKVIARGVSREVNQEEFDVLRSLTGTVGIVETESSAQFIDKKGVEKGVVFQPIYVMNLFQARRGEYKNEIEWARQEKMALGVQLLEGLSAISLIGVHRDIKLENILIADKQDRAVISDFGLYSSAEKHPTGAGTVTYMAPEILRDPELNSKPADVWAMGLVLYQLFHDDFPDWMVGLDPREAREAVLALPEGWQRRELKHLNLRDPVDQLIYNMLHINPERRITAPDALLALRSIDC